MSTKYYCMARLAVKWVQVVKKTLISRKPSAKKQNQRIQQWDQLVSTTMGSLLVKKIVTTCVHIST